MNLDLGRGWVDEDGIRHVRYLVDLMIPDGQWEACHFPERPPEGGKTLYAEGCRPCAVAAEARARGSGRPIDRIGADKLWELLERI